MYYVIELCKGQEMTIRDAEDNELMDRIKALNSNDELKVFRHKDFIAIQQEKVLTTYFTCESDRNNMVEELLNKGYKKSIEYLNNID
ncbi:MAG: hypothetical protein ACTHJ2_09690 [Candidatus Nitrosocosmicus sp.]